MAYKHLNNTSSKPMRIVLLVRRGSDPGEILNRVSTRLDAGASKTVQYGDDANPYLSGVKLVHDAEGSAFTSKVVVQDRGSKWDDIMNTNNTLTFSTTDVQSMTGSETSGPSVEPPEEPLGDRYAVQNQWGGSSAPWHDGGVWVLGARPGQPVVAIDVQSSNGGDTLSGTMTYSGEGPIGFLGTRTGPNTYEVQNQWGGSSAPWHPGGTWTIGGRENQNVVALSVRSPNNGMNLDGTMTYAGEGPIGFRGSRG